MLLTAIIVYNGVEKGIERVSKIYYAGSSCYGNWYSNFLINIEDNIR